MNTYTKEIKETSNTSHIETASRRRRFFAYILDSIIVSLCIQILLAFSSLFFNKDYSTEYFFFSIFSLGVSFAYFSLFPISSWWGTPGQRIMKIYVCDKTNNSRISLPLSILRVFVFNLLWIVSFALSAIILLGSDIKDIKNILHKGMHHKKYINLDGRMFYKDNPYYISFHDEKNNNTIHLLNTIGTSPIIIETPKHRLIVSHNGAQISEEYYDNELTSTNQAHETTNAIDQTHSTTEALFFLIIKLMNYSVLLFLVLLILPTMLTERKQTIYDMICNVFVARGPK